MPLKPLELTDDLVLEVTTAFRDEWANVAARAVQPYDVNEFLCYHGVHMFLSFLEHDATDLIRTWLLPWHADAVAYFDQRSALGSVVPRSLHMDISRTRFQVAREAEIYNASAANPAVNLFARKLSDFVRKKHNLPDLIHVCAVSLGGDENVNAARLALRSALNTHARTLDQAMLTPHTLQSMHAVLKSNESWNQFPADLLFFTSLATADSDLSEPGALCVVFQKASLVLQSTYAMVMHRIRARSQPVRSWRNIAGRLLASGSNFSGESNSYLSERDVGDVHYVAGAAIFLFVTTRSCEHVDVAVDTHIVRPLVVHRDVAVADIAHSFVYKKSLDLELHDGFVFVDPAAFNGLFLPLAKRFFSFPACENVDHYRELAQVTRSEAWRRFVATLVSHFYIQAMPAEALALGSAIESLVTKGICGKFVRILLSIRYQALKEKATAMERGGL